MVMLNYTDNCAPPGSVAGMDVSDGMTCPETITRSWTFTDSCNNTTTVQQFITIQDNTPPVFTSSIPANITVSCTSDITPTVSLNWSDNCDGVGSVDNVDVSDGMTCPETITRTWTYTDACNNTVTAQQIITVHDQVFPTLSAAPADISVECPQPMTQLTWNDNCDGTGMIDGVDISDGNSCPEVITRIWTYMDGCGNTVADTQIITMNDVTAPVITGCPSAIEVNCPSSVPGPDPSAVTWTDNCGSATVTHVSTDTVSGFSFDGSSCPALLSRTYMVTDDCGNTAICTQYITIRDRCDPNTICPLCDNDVPFFFVDLSDNPDSMWVSPNVVRNGTCCGETGPPPPRCIHFSVILPQDVIAISFEIPTGAVPGGALYYQIDCDEIQQVGDTICLQGGTTYQLTFCEPGNNPNTYAITAYSGDVLPDSIESQIDCAADISVEGITSSSATWNSVFPGSTGQYNSYLDCLSGCLTNTFTPDSNSPPVIYYQVCGDAGTLICGSPVNICDTVIAIVYPEIVVTVNPNPAVFCEDSIGTLVSTISPPGTYQINWYDGPDGTGNIISNAADYTPTSSGDYSVTVIDLVNNYVCNSDTENVSVTIVPLPQFELGPDTTICLSDQITFDLPDGPVYTWTPNTGVTQGGDPSIFIIAPTDTTNYTVIATTPEGCDTMDNITINVLPCQLNCPSYYLCSSSEITVYNTVADFTSAGGVVSLPCNVQNTSISLTSSSSDGMTCPETLTYTYEITDDCGNSASCDVIIIINDTIPPTWDSTPVAIGPLSCFDPVPAHEVLTGTDNCATIINTSVDPYTVDFCNGYTVTLRWTLQDSCGNMAPDQTVDVQFLPPALPVWTSTLPPDTTFTCEDIVNYNIPDLNFSNGETGSCEISGTVSGVVVGTIDNCGGMITAEWMYTDTCGRLLSHVQTITVEDNQDPVIDCPPDNTYECMADLPTPFTSIADFENAGGMISDNCGIDSSTFDMIESVIVNGCQRIITRLYSIEDSCGNYAECDQVFTIEDVTLPIIACPDTVEAECNAQVPALPGDLNSFTTTYGGSASDNCGIESFMVTENTSGVACSTVIQRIFTVTDSCGLSASCEHIISVVDTIEPTIVCPPDVTVSCGVDVPAPLSYADFVANGWLADNCGLIQSSFAVVTSDNGTCPRVIERTYSIQDSCGNIGSCLHTVVVNDTIAPAVTCPPDATIACLSDLPAPYSTPFQFISNGGSILDNCGIVGSTFTSSDSTDLSACPVVYRTYIIEDSCGNVGSCQIIYTVNDNVAPVINCPGDVSVECINDLPVLATSYSMFVSFGGSASDNCALDTSTFAYAESLAGTCPRVFTRTYSIADSCGNTNQCVQIVTVNDITAPVVNCPGDLTFECVADVPAILTTYADFVNAGGSASDNCGLDETTFAFSESSSGSCPQTITRTYSIADTCGNIGQCVQTITVGDVTPPTINCPGNLTFECVADVPAAFASFNDFVAGGGSASDNCGLDEATFSVTESASGQCPRTITRTYSIADSCGNTSQCVQTFTVNDITPPTINCPGNLTFECVADVPAAFASFNDFVAGGGSASDNCGLDEATFSVTESASGQCPRTITRTYSIADSCGNTSQCVQTFTVNDITPPTINCPGNLTFECVADVPAAFASFNDFVAGGGSASDNCGLDEATFSVTESASGQCPRTITRTYSIADSCGNTSQCVQTFTVNDITPPTINCPGNLTFECVADVPAAFASFNDFVAGGGSASDNCGLDEASFSVTESASGQCPRTITRTYSIADSCGNTSQCVQTFTVNDITPPTINCPGNLTFECVADVPAILTTYADFVNAGGSASDNCGLDETTFAFSESSSGSCPQTITRTYSIADTCGNIGQCVQTITVGDVTPPTINCPGNLTFECVADVPAAFASFNDFVAGGGSASDNCGLDEATFSVTESASGQCPRTITRTYSIADSCGNTSQCVQTFTVNDITPPTINCPGNLTFECVADVPAAFASFNDFVAGGGSASDNCGLDEATFSVTESASGQCPRTITRTYSIADSCGNTSQCVQTFTVNDITPPTINCPGNLTFECVADVPAAFASFNDFVAGGGSASDNCGLDEATFSVTESASGQCPRTITRTYSIADSCGNTSQCVQTFTVNDITPPTINCPGNLTFECVADVPAAFASFNDFVAGGGSASDNCGLDEASFSVTESASGQCPRTITRTYSIADSCGNTSQCVQTFTVNDITPPTINCPGNLTFECVADVPAILTTYADFVNAGGSASDNCGLDEATFAFSESSSGSCPQTITRTYSIADTCGNIGQCVQTITVGDVTPPTINCPGNLTFECVADVPAAFASFNDFVAGGGSASDNCGLDEATFSVTESASGQCPRTITRTYSIADSCGNTSQCVQTFTVNDITPPTINCPGNLTFECVADVPAAFASFNDFVAGGGSASDNCGLDEATFSVTESASGQCPRTITRTYSIADSCGNTSQCVQTFTVNDITPPTINCPGNLTFECVADVPAAFASFNDFVAGGGSASDNCGLDEATFSVTESASGQCPRTITRTYSIADSCGNTSQCVQTFTVNDITPPTINCPGNLTFECVADVPAAFASFNDFVAGGGSASDNCGLDEASFSVTESASGQCPRTITRTYSIADSCGNTSQCVQTFTVNDITPPTINCPGNLTFECVADVPAILTTYADFVNAGGSASDNCGLDETTFAFSESSSGSCPQTITRTYSIADTCGNIGQCVQTITVGDVTPPTINCPGDLTFECVADVPAAFASFNDFVAGGGSASDNCGLDETTFSVTESASGQCPRTITRTYSIADSCGNTSQCVQTFTVNDITPPTINCPGNLTFECVADVPAAFASFNDFVAGGGSASDNCGLDEATFSVTESASGQCPRTITRTYSIADSCGNTSQCVQTFTVNDITPPTINCPGNLTFECVADVPAAFASFNDFVAGGGSASDNCGLDEATFSVTESASGQCPRTITRTYSIADSCGNTSQCVQTFTVNDITPPTINCPGNLTFECVADVPAAFASFNDFVAGGGSASDNCGLDEASFSVTESASGQCPRTITRTYSIADSCGNTSQCVQTFTVNDITPAYDQLPG